MIPERTKKPAPEAVPSPPPLPEEAPESPRRRPWLRWVLILGFLVVAVYLFAHRPKANEPKGGQGAGAAGQGAQRPVPVLAAKAATRDVSVYLNGLGTVTALNTVNVRSRVDGQLLRIDFQEGQRVRAGQLLAELDPRPFQVQLMQAEGQKRCEPFSPEIRID